MKWALARQELAGGLKNLLLNCFARATLPLMFGSSRQSNTWFPNTPSRCNLKRLWNVRPVL